MRQLRILELIKSLDIGGAETLLAERLRLVDRERFDWRVAYLDPNRNALVQDISGLALPVTCLDSRTFLDWSWMIRLRRILRSEDVDIVHVHSPLMAAGVRAAVRSLGKGRPGLVTTEHSFRHHSLTQVLDAATVPMDDRVIAVSQAVAGSAVCRRAKHVEVLHHGVNVERMRQAREARRELTSELALRAGPRVVAVANHRPEKGHETLLRAARLIRDRVPEVQFYVAGHGPMESSIRKRISDEGMSGYYHLLGALKDAFRLAACADVFVLPSDKEGRPVALMEALACGVPCVATRVGGVPDLIADGSNGFVVEPRDHAALSERVCRLLGDAELNDRIGRAATESSEEYDLAIATRRLEAIYRELAQSRFEVSSPRRLRPVHERDSGVE